MKRIKARVAANVKANLCFSLSELADERALMKTKWFGYRFMTPEAATAMFARLYVEYLQYSIQKTRDRNMKVKDIDWLSFNQGGEAFIVCWRARKRADLFCIPYEAYLTFSFDFASRRKRKFAPQINQLHGGPKSREVWLQLFDEVLREQTWPALCRLQMPQYHTGNFAGLPPQRDYRDFVLKTAADTSLVKDPWRNVIERFSYLRNEIPLEHFERHLGDEFFAPHKESLEREVAQGRLSKAPAPKLDAGERLPSCFGLPVSGSASSAACERCSVATICNKVTLHVQSAVKAKSGHLDPVDFNRRQRQNSRQTISRVKRAEAPEASTHAAS
jgi:hypothetical protein